MRTRTPKATVLAMSLMLACPAAAQDAFMPGTSPMDLAPQSQALTSSVIGNLSTGGVAAGSGGRRRPAAHGTGAARGFVAGAGMSDARLPFATTPATRRQAMDAYIARAARQTPPLPAEARRALTGVDVHRQVADALRPNGLRADDAADVMAAFLLAGWEIMNGREPTATEVRNVRRQSAGQLLASPPMRDPAIRTKFAEELKVHLFVLTSGYAGARQQGRLAQYRQGTAQIYWRITGRDVGRWTLSAGGFSER